MRGIPNSGKSFTAKEMLKKYGGGDPYDHIFSTDDYWIQDLIKEKRQKLANNEPIDHQFYDELERDTYRSNWNPDKLGSAHGWNFYRFKNAVDRWITPIVVDNTNVTAREIAHYAKYAKNAGYKIIIQEPTSPWWQDHRHMLNDKQKHGTELENFARFLAGYHQGMEQKYNAKGNQHGVPLDVIRRMIRRWQPNLSVDEVLNGRDE